MALHSNAPLPFGDFIDMRFRFDEHEIQILDVSAEVMQNYKKRCVHVTGIKFVAKLSLNSTFN